MSDRIYTDDEPGASENFVTVAQACHGVLTKRNFENGTQKSYDHVKLYNFTEHFLTDLYDLYALSIGMLTHPNCCFIRARIKDEDNTHSVVRKVNETLILEKCNWVPLDIDWQHPNSGNLKADLETVLDALPEIFRGVECFAVASASYCFKAGIRMRLFFWNSKPVSGIDIRNALRGYEKIADPALYNPIQPIYTAAPLGVDVVKDRIVWRQPLFAKPLLIPITDYEHARGAPEIWYSKNRANKHKAKHLERISWLSTGERHSGLITEGYPLGKLIGQGHFDREIVIDEAMAAMMEWMGKRDIPKDRATIVWAIDKGIEAMSEGN